MTNHIGIGVVLRRGDEVLLGVRRSSHGAGRYSLPGGGLEGSETFAECAARETREETGIVVAPERFAAWTFTDDPFPAIGKRFATLYLVAEAPESARLLERTGGGGARFIPGAEPDKCERWEWHAWSRLPAPLFGGLNRIRHLELPAREDPREV